MTRLRMSATVLQAGASFQKCMSSLAYLAWLICSILQYLDALHNEKLLHVQPIPEPNPYQRVQCNLAYMCL